MNKITESIAQINSLNYNKQCKYVKISYYLLTFVI